MLDYSGCYATLGVTPDTDWKTLRTRYRHLIGQWHPDRFSDANGIRVAEENTKHITLAYQALHRYRRDHGVLPPLRPAPVGESTARGTDPRPTSAPARQVAGDEAADSNVATRSAKPKPKPRNFRSVVVLLALAAAIYLVVDPMKELVLDPAPQQSAPEVEPTSTPEADPTRESGGIRIGSTLGDVYAIQGVPTLTEGDTWYYGKSRVRFAQGKVTYWEEHPDNPLHVDREQAILQRGGLFGVGSTKEEVRAVQGPPSTETDSIWYYAPSAVYFENNRVVRWEESPARPLRVAR